MSIQSKARSLRNRLGKVFSGEAGRRHAAVGPAHLWKMKRQFQIDFLKNNGLEQQHSLIDIGCGTLRGGIPLIKLLNKGQYTGIEVREDVLELGRDELREAKLESQEPNLIHSQGLSTLDLEYKVDFIWAFAVLIHMDDDALNGCLSFVSRHLEPTGSFYGNVNIGEAENGSWQGFPVVYRPMAWYVETAERFGLVPTDVGSLVELGHDDGRPEPESRRMLKFTHIDPDRGE
jgi:SAM-dependent methyltransferase